MSIEVKITPKARRLIHSKLAQFCVESKGSDMYHFMQAFEILRSNVGDEPLRKHFGNKYRSVVKRLRRLNCRLNKLKMYYDSMPRFDENTRESRIKELWENEYANMPLVNGLLYKCFSVLLENTEIRFVPIPNECFKLMDRKDKKLEDDSKKKDENRTK